MNTENISGPCDIPKLGSLHRRGCSTYVLDGDNARHMVGQGNFIEIQCKYPIDICETRDTKGLYEKARAGQIQEFTGIPSPYETPEKPELVVDTGTAALGDCVQRVVDELARRGIISKE